MKRTNTREVRGGVSTRVLAGIAALAFSTMPLTGCGNETPPEEPTRPQLTVEEEAMPLGKLSDTAVPRHYTLDMTIDPSQDRFSGTVRIAVELSRPVDRIWLHGRDMNVTDAFVETENGTRVKATYVEEHVTGIARLQLDAPVDAGTADIQIAFDRAFNTSPAGLYKATRGEDAYAASQLQAIDARQVFPGFDEPRFKVPFKISVTAPTGDTVVVAMPEESAQDLGNGMTRHEFAETPPLPTYLLAFVVGPYDVNTWEPLPANDVRSEPLPLRGLAEKGRGDQLDYALENTRGLMDYLEGYFGIPHPYPKIDIVAAPDFFGGAMENVGAIIYNEYLLLMDETAPLRQRRSYTAVHAHEIAHMWFGNYVTPAWWDDIWLNESFASWMMYKAAHAHWPEGQFDRSILDSALGAMEDDSLAAARQIREPVDTNEQIEDAFDGITYRKGGGVLAMFENYLGEEAFRAGVRTHMERFANGVATVDDFMSSIAEGAGRPDIVPAFRSFIEQPGVPLVEASLDCSAEAPVLSVVQSRYRPLGSTIDPNKTWQIPMCVAYDGAEGRTRSCALITEKEQTVPLEAQTCPASIMPNANGASYYRFALDTDGWAALGQTASELDAREALAYADSLDAAFKAAKVSAAALVDGMAALAGHSAWDAASTSNEMIEDYMNTILSGETRDAAQAYARALFMPYYTAVQDQDGAEATLRRVSLARFLAIVAEEPSVRATMAEQGAAYLGLNGEADPSAVSADVRETVLSVAVQERGAEAFDTLLAMLEDSKDAAFRVAGIGALARTGDPVLAARLRDLALSDRFNSNEMFRIVQRQLTRDETRDATWQWLQENFDDFVARTPDLFRSQIAGGIGGVFCSADKRAEFVALIDSRKATLPGYERSYAQSLEKIDLCIALKDAKAGELDAAFKTRL